MLQIMVTCPNCNNRVFPVAEMCPRCGDPVKDQSSLGPLAILYAVMIPAGILAIWFFDFGGWGGLVGLVIAAIGFALLSYRAISIPW